LKKILFNRDSAIAYRKGFKCRTQRVIKSPAKSMQKDGCEVITRNPDNDPWYKDRIWSMRTASGMWGDYTNERFLEFCPYGKPGDRLQILTSWAVPKEYDDHKPSDLLGSDLHCEDIWTYFDSDQKPDCLGRIRSPLYMPGWLRDVMPQPKIRSIEARRLNEITESECLEEGFAYEIDMVSDLVSNWSYGDSKMPDMSGQGRHWYRNLWDHINSKRGYPWKSNPWVWNIKIENWNDLK
jgi:hypothetical protein